MDMKRGRPNIREDVQPTILKILNEQQLPLTIANITKQLSTETKKTISWNTTRKYLQELINTNKIQPITVPHSKFENKKGLTLYMLKR